MRKSVQQQIIISGVGGQGIIFVTRLLAEAAIIKEFPVFTSETHGMAQRGGTVVSHLKVGEFYSPMIRPFNADGMLILQSENLRQHSFYLKPNAWIVINGHSPVKTDVENIIYRVDADHIAQEIGNPKSVNLVLLGFSIAATSQLPDDRKRVFCSMEDIKIVLENRFAERKELLNSSIKALETGFCQRLKADY